MHTLKHVGGIRTHKRAPDDNVLSSSTFTDAFVGAPAWTNELISTETQSFSTLPRALKGDTEYSNTVTPSSAKAWKQPARDWTTENVHIKRASDASQTAWLCEHFSANHKKTPHKYVQRLALTLHGISKERSRLKPSVQNLSLSISSEVKGKKILCILCNSPVVKSH